MTDRYLVATDESTRTRIACDEDTKYWIFDDHCEPVGLTCEPKAAWQRVSHADYDRLTAARRSETHASQPDATADYFRERLLRRGRPL